MRIAITGATGFVGQHILKAMVEAGHTPLAVVRNVPKAERMFPGVESRPADLSDASSLAAAFAGVDAVVANAALAPGKGGASAEAFREANVAGTLNTLSACRSAGVQRVVGISSVSIYRTKLWRSMDERTPKRDPGRLRWDWTVFTTNQDYAQTKALAEREAWRVAAESGLHLTMLRPGPVYGSADNKLTASWGETLRKLAAPAPLVSVPMVHAGDVGLAVAGALATEQSIHRAYNVTGSHHTPWEVLQTLKPMLGSRTALIPIVAPLGIRIRDERARQELPGYTPRPLKAGLNECAAWLKEQA